MLDRDARGAGLIPIAGECLHGTIPTIQGILLGQRIMYVLEMFIFHLNI